MLQGRSGLTCNHPGEPIALSVELWKGDESMLHPALLDFGVPWNYVSVLFAQTLGTGASLSVQPTGIRLETGTGTGSYATTQRVSEIKAAAGKRLLVAGRFLLSTLTQANLWFGAWETDGDPINGILAGFDGVFIERNPSTSAIRGRRIKDDNGTSRDNTTADLVTLTEDVFVDVAVLVLEDDAVQFLALRSDGAWAEQIIDTYVPVGANLRPSVAVQKSSSGGDAIQCDVWSFFVHEEI
jgi:hypothetical protein